MNKRILFIIVITVLIVISIFVSSLFFDWPCSYQFEMDDGFVASDGSVIEAQLKSVFRCPGGIVI